MAGNFWNSSHYQQWLLDRQDLVRERQADLKVLSEEEYHKLMIFFAGFIQALGEAIKVRQQVIATATVYFKRFYARNSLKSIDPLLMAPTSLYLASKVEECGPISNSRLISTCQTVLKNKFSYAWNQEFPYRIQSVLECEFYLLEMMDCCLILYHPYRPLIQYAADLNGDESLLQLAWRIVNDTLRTDIPLMFPPYMIALACLHMACVIQHQDSKQWFAELSVNMDKVLDITKLILALYELWKSYDDKKDIPGLLAKMPKAKTSPSRPPSQNANGQVVPPNQQLPSQPAPQLANQMHDSQPAANPVNNRDGVGGRLGALIGNGGGSLPQQMHSQFQGGQQQQQQHQPQLFQQQQQTQQQTQYYSLTQQHGRLPHLQSSSSSSHH